MLNLNGLEGLAAPPCPHPGGGRPLSDCGSDPADADGPQEPSMRRDLEFIQRNYHKFYSCLDIEVADDLQCLFWLASKRQPHRRLRLTLSQQTAFTIVEDPEQKLTGQQFESFEQVMSAMDKGDFGDLLCGLAAQKLAEQEMLSQQHGEAFDPRAGTSTSSMNISAQFHDQLAAQLNAAQFGQVADPDAGVSAEFTYPDEPEHPPLQAMSGNPFGQPLNM